MFKKFIYYVLPWIIAAIMCVMAIQQCQRKNDIEEISKHNIEALTDSVHHYKDAYGKEYAAKAILFGDINTLRLANDSLAQRIEALVKKPEHVVYINNEIVHEKHDTCWKVSVNDTVKHFDFSDKWRVLQGDVTLRNNNLGLSVNKDIVYADFAIAVKDGRAYVSSSNPYVRVNDIQGYVLPKQKKKWFHVGPSIGVGIGTDGKVRPFAGVSGTLSIVSW